MDASDECIIVVAHAGTIWLAECRHPAQSGAWRPARRPTAPAATLLCRDTDGHWTLSDIFSAAGLPSELAEYDDFDVIAIEQLELRISTDSRRYGKLMTIVNGMDGSVDPKKILSVLKTKCACGGAYKDGHIELQGDHAKKVKGILDEMGFQARIG